MKGFVLKWPVKILIVFLIILVSILIFQNLLSELFVPPLDLHIDAKYACVNYNNSKINQDKFEAVLYAFLTDQCNNFFANLEQGISFEDIERIIARIDESVIVIRIDSCKLPSVNSHSVYVCCSDFLEAGKAINITRREIKNSDVLICEANA